MNKKKSSEQYSQLVLKLRAAVVSRSHLSKNYLRSNLQ